jgi:hypothetical protein
LANPHALDTKIKRLIEAARKKRAGSARNAFLDAPLDGSAAVPEAVTAGVVAAPVPAAAPAPAAGATAPATSSFNSVVQKILHDDNPCYDDGKNPIRFEDLSDDELSNVNYRSRRAQEENVGDDADDDYYYDDEEGEEKTRGKEESKRKEEPKDVYSRAAKLVDSISSYVAKFFSAKKVSSRVVARSESKEISALKAKVSDLQRQVKVLSKSTVRSETSQLSQARSKISTLEAAQKTGQIEMDRLKQELSAKMGDCEELQAKLDTITMNFSPENVAKWKQGAPYPPIFLLMLMECLALNSE